MHSNMTPVDWAKRPLQKYADFSGRAPRAEFLVSSADSTFWVSTTGGAVNVRGAPLMLASYGSIC